MSDCKKEILVTSFGTSYNNNCAKTIDVVNARLRSATLNGRRGALSSRMIIRRLRERDRTCINCVSEIMDTLSAEGFGTVVVQPTYIMNSEEYDDVLG